MNSYCTKLSILLGLLLCVYSLSAQKLGTYDLTDDIARLNTRIAKQLKKSRCEQHQEYGIAHMLLFVSPKNGVEVSKEDLLSDSLIYRLKPSYRKVKSFLSSEERLITIGLVYNSNKEVFASSDERAVYCDYRNTMGLELQYILDKANDVKLLMMLSGFSSGVYFVVTHSDEVKAITIKGNKLEEHSLRDFVDNEWDSYRGPYLD